MSPLDGLATEYVDGEWRLPTEESDPSGVITFTTKPMPNTGHVGWYWWALGKMGDASSYEDAKQQVQTWVQARLKGMPASGRKA